MGDAGPKTKPQKRGKSSPWMPRLRKRGEKILHSKYVVILVIILTIVDCSLVIAELILDLYSVKKTLSATEGQTFKFIRNIRTKYPDEVMSNDSVFSVFERISQATILWNSSMELELFLKCHNLSIDTTTINSVSISLPSGSSFEPMRKMNDETLGYYAQTSPKQMTNWPEVYERHLRRVRRTNVESDPHNLQDNEKWLRLKIENLFRVYIRRAKRYLPINTKSFNDNVFHKDGTFYGNNSSNNINGNTDNSSWISNNSSRFLYDLIKLHRQISNFFHWQDGEPHSQEGHKQATISPFSGSRKYKTNGEEENINDGGLSVDRGSLSFNDGDNDGDNGEANVGNAAESGGLYSNVMFSDASGGLQYNDVDVKEDKSEMDIQHSGTSSHQKEAEHDETDDEAHMRRELHHSKEMEIAHKLHYASVCVVSVLLIEVTMKIVCAGSHFAKRKIEVFDAVVIVTSVVVDLIFIKGLSEFAVDDSIFVLVLLLPWRVIRVVNSLVMAVIDHEHVKLRLLYSRKKKLDKTVDTLRNEVDELKGMLQDVRSFCIKEGIGCARIDSMLGKFAPRRRKDSKFYTLVKLVMSTASINNNDNDSVSSSSIENDLRHYTNRDSILNEATSNDGTIASLKGYLSVPFSNGDSQSASEVESIIEEHINTSPSIYITSPASEEGMFSFCDVELGDNDVFGHRDTSDCIEEEDSAANIDVTSTETNSNTKNGVAFYVGSQTSFNSGFLHGSLVPAETEPKVSIQGVECRDGLVESVSSNAIDAIGLAFNPHFGQFLTVPHCTVSVCSGTNTISISSNYNETNAVGECVSSITSTTLLPHGSNGNEMRRSISDNVNVTQGKSPYEGAFRRVLYGSPIPARRLPEIRTRRKNYTKYRSESDDDSAGLMKKREFKNRLRRYSGDPHAAPGCPLDKNRARSHSPTPMTLLSVPGNKRVSNEITCSSSRSMNDVSFASNQSAHKFGGEGRILRRSCLSLNSEGQKRRTKSPHRVSFKVS